MRQAWPDWKQRDGLFGTSCILPFFLGLAIFVYGVLGIKGFLADYRKEVRSHWHESSGLVVQRGPYQGDVANVSYRLVTLRYKDFYGRQQHAEKMVSWDTQVDDKFWMRVSDMGHVYTPADVTYEFAGDPYHPNTDTKATARFFLSLAIGAGVWLALGTLVYWARVLLLAFSNWRSQRKPHQVQA